jgi:hypothetical protein
MFSFENYLILHYNFQIKASKDSDVIDTEPKKLCANCQNECSQCNEKIVNINEQKKNKEFIDMNVDYLNHQMFWFIFFSLFVSNLGVWIYLSLL